MEQLDKFKILEKNAKRIQESLRTYGYNPLPIDRSNYMKDIDNFYAHAENQSIGIKCGAFISRHENQWKIDFDLYKSDDNCFLSLLLPDLKCRNLANDLNFENTTDIGEFTNRCAHATDVMIKIINSDLKTYILGQSWKSAPSSLDSFQEYIYDNLMLPMLKKSGRKKWND